MLLIRYFDGVYHSGDVKVVARSIREGSFFVLKGKTLKLIPREIITSKIYPRGMAKIPPITEWLPKNLDKVENFDYSLNTYSTPQ